MIRKPYTIECHQSELSSDAIHWIENSTYDLAWITRCWRTWTEPARTDEFSLEEYSKILLSNTSDPEIPLRRRKIDAVQFVSKRDALYFKLVFLDDAQGNGPH